MNTFSLDTTAAISRPLGLTNAKGGYAIGGGPLQVARLGYGLSG